ncbi:hypothetical protein EC9_10400 [Rosistilla ulvae]|uniref:Type II secretion system protein n=1 Tax=Rosistilla ulvae TaxID=1930277 RepID=A0A517LW68_9BACT|nr:hypothetical protein [Rosistilla ulvae]QDS86865.1 hypothetical protein EC9_10400 [Rosistilla ulvae]
MCFRHTFNRCQSPPRRGCRRGGGSMIELVVSATLLVALIGTFAPMSLSAGRLWQQTRHHQLALDELSNHLDRLLALPEDQRNAEIESLEPSAAAQAALPDARLTAVEVSDGDGVRLTIQIDWQRQTPAQPLSLTGWIRGTHDE